MERIVVGVDGSDGSDAALRWAMAEARVRGARLEPILAWEFPLPTEFYSPTHEDLEAGAHNTLKRAMAGIDDTGVELAPDVVEASPATALLTAARDADLLVVGSHGHGAFVGMMLGSVSLRVVTHAPCPVVVVPSDGP